MALPASVSQWGGLAQQSANKYGVDPNLVLAVIWQESGGNPQAVSSTGAQGLMQLEPSTAVGLGVANSFDPAQNIDGGTKYIAQLLHQYNGDVTQALGHYYGCVTCIVSNNQTYPQQVLEKYHSIGAAIVGAIHTISAAIIDLLKKVYSYPVTQKFGPTNFAVEPAYGGFAHFHEGIDLGVPFGTQLPSLFSGTVEAVYSACSPHGAGYDLCGSAQYSGYGNSVLIRLANGYQVLYGHLLSPNVQVGQSVNVGDIVGTTNNTGASTGSHVHIMLKNGSGTQVDPTPYIQAASGGNSNVLTSFSPNLAVNPNTPILGGLSGIIGALGHATDSASALAAMAGLVGNVASYFVDPEKRPVLLFIGFGAVLTVVGLKDMAQGKNTSAINLTLQSGQLAGKAAGKVLTSPVKLAKPSKASVGSKMIKTAAKAAVLA